MSDLRCAEMLIVGFQKHWRLLDMLWAIGESCESEEDAKRIHAKHAFLPENEWIYRRPVRAYVADEWPKLNEFLLKHTGNPERMLSAAAQVNRLTSSSMRGAPIRSNADKAEMNKANRGSRRHRLEHQLSMTAQRSNQRGAWNVCKG